MTDIYFDSVNGHDYDSGTKDLPKQSYDAYAQGTMTAGDTYHFKRGTTQVISTANTQVKQGTSSTVRTKYKAYGEAQVPYSIWTPPPTGTLANDFILNGSGRSYIDYEDMYFDCLGRVSYSIYMVASASAVSSSHKLSRCYFTNAKIGGSGLVVGAASTTPGAGTDIIVEDSFFFANPTHGMLVNGANGVIVRRSKFHGNGFSAVSGGHGFSAKARRTDATSGWTLVSGTIWQRSLASYEPDVYYCKTSVSGYQRLAKNTSTPTTPGIGEFGATAGVMYINVNSATNPATQGVNYAWGKCYNIIVEDCESYGNIWDVTAPEHEGHGIALDDYTELSIVRRNHLHDNQGCAVTVNRGDNNLIDANVGHDNWLAGVAGSGCWNTTVKHNTFHDNNTGATGTYNGEIAFFTYAQNGVISNNILKGTKTYGIDVDTTCAGFSGSNNNVYGAGSIDRSGAYTASVTVDPLLDAEHRATAATVKRGGIYLGGRDYNGKYHTNPPSIGAVSDHRTPAWAAVATR